MLIDQALDATILLSTLCLFNVIFAGVFVVAIILGPLGWSPGNQWQGPVRPSWMLALVACDLALGCLYPLILLGVETFGPLSRNLVLAALGLGVALPLIMSTLAAILLVARYRSGKSLLWASRAQVTDDQRATTGHSSFQSTGLG